MDLAFQIGLPPTAGNHAATLYDEAFRQKLKPAITDDAARVAIIARGLDPTKCIAALAGDDLLGIAGFHDRDGSLTGDISFSSIKAEIGLLRAIKAIAVLALLDRKPRSGELLMDGIVVRADARGRGIGTGLFDTLETYARERSYRAIRLDVVDTNPAARRLYERLGFVATKTDRMPYMRWMGFTGSTTMVKQLDGMTG